MRLMKLVCFAFTVAITANVAFGQAASLIQYTYDAAGNVIQITRSAAPLQPDLTVTNLVAGTVTVNANGSFNIPVTFQVNNVGTAIAVTPWTDRGYLSANSILHDTDQVLSGVNTRSANLAIGASYSANVTFTTNAATAAGVYTLIVKADGGAARGQFSPTGPNVISESNEANNVQTVVVTLPANAQPDLIIGNASIGTITIGQSGAYSIPVTYTVTNVGTGVALPNFYTLAYLSNDGSLDNADQNLGGSNLRSTALGGGTSYTTTTSFTSTAATLAGSYTLLVKADGRGQSLGTGTNTDGGRLVESNEANNIQAIGLTLPAKPDLVVSNVSLGAITISQAGAYSVPVTYTVTNFGGVAAPPNWYDLAYLSSDETLDNADQNLTPSNLRGVALAAGTNYVITKTFSTTAATVPGSYTLFIKTDGRGTTLGSGTNTDGGNLVESIEANNVQAVGLTLPAKPDLVVSNVSLGAITISQAGTYSVPVTYTVTNSGGVAARPNWYDMAYLSSDGTLDNADQNLSPSSLRSVVLDAGSNYVITKTFTTTAATMPGTYTLFIKADGRGTTLGTGTNTDGGNLVESNDANNVQAMGLTLPAKPDLVLSNLSVGTIVKNGNGSKSIPVTFNVTNAGGLAAPPTWYDLAYLSTDATLDDLDQNLTGSNSRTTALSVAGSYTVTMTFVTSVGTPAGAFTLFLKSDGRGATVGTGTNTDQGRLAEANEVNNVISTAVILP